MAFVVATGLVLGAADSYVSLAAADAYFEALQDTAWATVDDDKKMALLSRASTTINQRYEWTSPASYTSVPRALAIATYELAKHWSVSTTATAAEGQKVKQVDVGAISVTFSDPDSVSATSPDQIYSFLDMILSQIGVSVFSASTSGGWGIVTVSRS